MYAQEIRLNTIFFCDAITFYNYNTYPNLDISSGGLSWKTKDTVSLALWTKKVANSGREEKNIFLVQSCYFKTKIFSNVQQHKADIKGFYNKDLLNTCVGNF